MALQGTQNRSIKTNVSYSLSSPGHFDLERGFDPENASPSSTQVSDNVPGSRASEKPLTAVDASQDHRMGHHPTSVLQRAFDQQFRAADSGEKQPGHMSIFQTGNSTGQHWRNHIVAALGEFVGTTMFLFFAFTGTAVAKTTAGDGQPGTDSSAQTYIALCFGFSLMANVWVFYRISGGLFNPAVTLALVLIRAISPFRSVFVLTAQLLGGIAAAGLSTLLLPTPLNVSTSLADDVSLAQGVVIEALLTFELVLTILMLAVEKHRATFVAPVGIGLALFVAELSGVYYTGGSLNPARSLGPCVIAAEFPSEHWIYWVGPGIGSLAAIALYKAIKWLHYETANPGQDASHV